MTNKMLALVATDKKATPELIKVDLPQIKADEVLVEVAAASINPVDQNYKFMNLAFKIPVQYPMILGNDFSGTVVAVGDHVKTYQVGDRVYGRTNHAKTGTYAEYLAIETSAIAKMPQNLSFVEAAAVPLVGLTAYQGLFDQLELKANQTVFIGAGSGGVGTMAIQLAKAKGAYVATTTSPKNFELMKELGADEIIDYHQQDFSEVLHDYDAVFDTHGKTDTVKAVKILKSGGKIRSIAGIPSVGFSKINHLGFVRTQLFKLAARSITKPAQAKQVDYEFFLMKSNGHQLAKLTQLIEAGQLKPIVDQTFTFQDIKQAFEVSSQGHVVGKVVVKIK